MNSEQSAVRNKNLSKSFERVSKKENIPDLFNPPHPSNKIIERLQESKGPFNSLASDNTNPTPLKIQYNSSNILENLTNDDTGVSKKTDLTTHVIKDDRSKSKRFDKEKMIFETALSLYRKRLLRNDISISSSSLSSIFKELFQALFIKARDEEIYNLLDRMVDFIPKKITEQAFIDLLRLPQIKDFLISHNMTLDSQTARFTDSFVKTTNGKEEAGFEGSDINLETLSMVIILFLKTHVYI